MRLKLITCAWDAQRMEFDTRALEEFQQHHAISQFQSQYTVIDQCPVWMILAAGNPYPNSAAQSVKTHAPAQVEARSDRVRSTLGPNEQAVYDRLCAWRREAARTVGIAPFMIFTNEQAGQLTRARPATLADLRSMPHFGDKRVAQYGASILEILHLPETAPTNIEAVPANPPITGAMLGAEHTAAPIPEGSSNG